MEPLKPEVMFRQVAGLAGDLRQLTQPFEQQVRAALTPSEWQAVKKIYLTGDGDSYHASCAAEMAFEAIAGVDCEPLSAQRFPGLRHRLDAARCTASDRGHCDLGLGWHRARRTGD